jgi:hypothetical protein
VARHHTNWRLWAIESFNRERKGDLPYSSVVNISAKAAVRLRELLQEFLSGSRKIIDPSPEEKLYGLCLDFFPLTE